MKYLIIIAMCCIAVFIQSCEIDGKTMTYISIKNTTTHQIEVIPYFIGIVVSEKQFYLESGQEHTIEYHDALGKTNNPSLLFFDYFNDVDSIIVKWDNQYEVVHMIGDSFISNNKYIAFLNERNLGNGKNAYYIEKGKETKHSIEWKAFYTFTEDDYNYAKD